MGYPLYPIYTFELMTHHFIAHRVPYLLFAGKVIVRTSVNIEDLSSLLVVIAKGEVLRLHCSQKWIERALVAKRKREEVQSGEADQIACDFTLIGVETATEAIRDGYFCNVGSDPSVLFVNRGAMELLLGHDAQHSSVIKQHRHVRIRNFFLYGVPSVVNLQWITDVDIGEDFDCLHHSLRVFLSK